MEYKLEESNLKFFNKIAKIYDRGIFRKIKDYRVKNTLKLADVKANSKILDIGCGTGNLLYDLSKDESLKLYGIDLSKNMLKIAREKLRNNAVLKLGNVKNVLLKYKKNYFDYIFIEDTFHHLPNQEKLIDKIKILLNKNGKLIISDLSFSKIGNFIFHNLEPGNSETYTLKEYKELFEEKKFKNIKQRRFGIISVYTEGVK
ncbi:MAG: methyltransferase domain-containing protein [Nanoarchaeota archaeon]